MKDNLSQDQFNVLRKINKEKDISQRIMAKELNISLGKLNYVVKELRKKGLIKLNNFRNNPSKLQYILTPKGIAQRTKLTINFMQRKMREYDELREELEKQKKVDVDSNKI
tara:strand:+ start:119 stop:451 length:333 start_codon:yes stop_codon:yes gene_type:complete